MSTFSIIIASKNRSNPKLKECLRSIEMQDYPKDDVEVLVITEGTPESAKAIGLKRAKGDIVCFMASDCEFVNKTTLRYYSNLLYDGLTGAYSMHYYYKPTDPILNRYFALFGFNDPIPFYLGKCDRFPMYRKNIQIYADFKDGIPTLGDNGFFVKRDLIIKTDLRHYSHIDNCEDLRRLGEFEYLRGYIPIHHKTGDSLWLWIKKRWHYAESLNRNRRWKMVSNGKDMLFLFIFVLVSMTLLEPLLRSVYGYLKSGIKDKAWFLHPVICFITVFLYGALWIKIQVRKFVL